MNVDVAAVAAWLFEKLSGAEGTKTTYNKTEVKLSLKNLELIIEQESKTTKK